MGEVEEVVEESPVGATASSATKSPSRPRLSVLPLIALIFYDVSGGPFGVEDSVRAGGGPLLALLGFIVLPIFWSLPEALITAELAASFPENGGYVIWISSAFGPFWGFQVYIDFYLTIIFLMQFRMCYLVNMRLNAFTS